VFSLSGLNLTPSNGNIIVTSPVNFQISIDDVSFDSSLNIAYFGSELASTDIYVRLSEGLLIGTYNGDVTISGGGANTILNVEGAVTEFVNICGEEDFENIPTANSSSYSTRTWVGSNGVEWTVNDSRSDQTISGKAITLRVSTLTTTSPVNGGVGTISFDYKRSFTGNSTLKVFVNGTQYGGDIVVTDETPTNFSTEVNLGGDITIELVNTGQRTTIDNLSWTCYTSNTSILSVAPATITGLNYGLGNGPSTAQSFVLSGYNLEGSDVTVTALANFEVSTTEASGYASSITLTAVDGANQTVWVRLSAGQLVNTYNGSVTISGGGATDATVSV